MADRNYSAWLAGQLTPHDDLNIALRQQPDLESLASVLLRKYERALTRAKVAAERTFAIEHQELIGKRGPDGRTMAVESRKYEVRASSKEYQDLQERVADLEHVVGLLSDLRWTVTSRRSVLDQLANNRRHDERIDAAQA